MSGRLDAGFQQDIELTSLQSNKDTLYPRPDLLNLGQFLTSLPTHKPSTSSNSTTGANDNEASTEFAVIHTLRTGDIKVFGPSADDILQLSAHNVALEPLLIFLRGYASPNWLKAVRDKFKVSLEFYRRHLHYKSFISGRRDFYSLPALPSSSIRIFQLKIPTLCTRETSGTGSEPEDLQQARQREDEALDRYFTRLRTTAKVSDSVVRECVLLSKREYVLEQTISVEIKSMGNTWCAIIWLDNGRDLAHSVEGPWNPRDGTRSWETYFIPVIANEATIHEPLTGNGTRLTLEAQRKLSSSPARIGEDATAGAWRAAQNACLLPFQYGSDLDKALAQDDALYALSELLRFAAFAEAQYLNLVHKRIEHELSFIGDQNIREYHTVLLLNLKFLKGRLTSHVESLSKTFDMLRNRNHLNWPRGKPCEEKKRVAAFLLADYDYLLKKAERLVGECDQGMDTLANNSVLEESRRSTTMAEELRRLTILATVFIPLSFVCTFWGMNFRELGTGHLSLWVWPVSVAGISLLVLVGYRWNSIKYFSIERRRAKLILKGRNTF